MDDATTGQVTADAAELYDRFFVPALFAQWPDRLLDLAGAGPGDSVLDVGCGTGVLARAALRRVGVAGAVTGVDVNEGMLAVAARSEPDVTWVRGRAEELPVPDDGVDRALCQFAMMFVEDPGAAVAEMARVVRPGGALCVATWAALPETPGYAAMVDLVREILGDGPARALEAPFVLGTADDVRAVLEPGLGPVDVTRLDGVARFPSLDAWVATDVRAWTLADLVDDEGLDELQRAARSRLVRFCDDSGRVEFPAPALAALARV
jgi:SAM-dependent methyltransferase